MPAPSDILQYFHGQLFQTPTIPNDVDLTGKTIVITGANTGLGFESAKQLYLIPIVRTLHVARMSKALTKNPRAHLNISTLILACRSLVKGEAAKSAILASLPSSRDSSSSGKPNIQVWPLDMASYDSIVAFAQRLDATLPHLDGLVLNAGISTSEFHFAEEYERTLTVNVVGTFLLALLALPVLRRCASLARLTIVGSVVHCFASPAALQQAPKGEVFSTLSDPQKAEMGGRYFLSKLLGMLCLREFAARVPVAGEKGRSGRVVVNCVNPGWCKTELFRQDDGGWFARNLLRAIGRTAEVGGRTLTDAVVRAAEESHGGYLSENKVKNASVSVRSEKGEKLQEQIWEELIDRLEQSHPGVCDALGKGT